MLAFLLAVTVACNKDDDAPCTDLGDTLIGSWSVTAIGLDLGDVEFKSDGTLIDPDALAAANKVPASAMFRSDGLHYRKILYS